MVCAKCGYQEGKKYVIQDFELCSICMTFAPQDTRKLEKYVNETIDWKILEVFRTFGQTPGNKKKEGMKEQAAKGLVISRAPFGYDVVNKTLEINKEGVTVRSLFKEFLHKDNSLNQLSKRYALSVNGLKKVLTNRTYLGEIKFNGEIHKSTHQPLISPEVFYAVQRKLTQYLRPRKMERNRYKNIKGEVAPLTKEVEENTKPKVKQFNLKKKKSSGLYTPLFEEED